MDSCPVTARSLGRTYYVDGDNLERNYKNHLSGFRTWRELDHAEDWNLLVENMGTHLSIDETSIDHVVYVFLTNKDGHGKKHTLIAYVKGLKVSVIVAVLMQIPEELRKAVIEVTMDHSDVMNAVVREVFPDARITIDCFHTVQVVGDAIEEIRMQSKREAVKEEKKEKTEFKKRLLRNAKKRQKYAKKHPKTYKGKKRGRKPVRANARYIPTTLSNGDTPIDLLRKCRNMLLQSGEKWTEAQKERANVLFGKYPKIKGAYSLLCSLRSILRDTTLNKETAKSKLHEWYDKVAASTLREVKAARDTIKLKEDQVLNYFVERSTNASAESFNSKVKNFRAQLHGVLDVKFFMYRLCCIFG